MLSPKRQVILLIVIFSVLGVGVSVGIIAAGGGFTGQGPSIVNPPSEEDLWTVGENIEEGMILDYKLDAKSSGSSLNSADVSINFLEDAGDQWKVKFLIVNGTGADEKEGLATFSKQLTREGQISEDFATYYDPIHNSIFVIRDIAIGPKYLVIGAPWDIIFVGSSSVQVKITDKESIQTLAGPFEEAFVLSYTINEKTSRIWIVQDMPLPVKAEVYDSEGSIQYQYELTGFKSG